MTGIMPFGFIALNSGVSTPPKAPPTSMRSWSSDSSRAHQTTFCTLTEESFPQIRSIDDGSFLWMSECSYVI